jgi:deoxyribonuclease-4
VIKEALAESEGCPLHLENTAGTGGTLGRTFAELHQLIDAAGGDERLGVCLDSCHLLASGYEVRTVDGLNETMDELEREVGLDRLGSLHFNDSQTPLGSNRDRHANVGEGEIGEDGCAVFLSEPRFEDLPCVLETPGPRKEGPTAEEIALTRSLRERGLRERTG